MFSAMFSETAVWISPTVTGFLLASAALVYLNWYVFAHPYWNLIYGYSINFFEDKKHKEPENWWLPKSFFIQLLQRF